MKVNFLLTLILLATTFVSTSYSQNITVRAGINSSVFEYQPLPDEFTANIKEEIRKAGIGPHAGVVLELPSKYGFSLQGGAFISHKGESDDITFIDTTYQKRFYCNYSFYYLEVPVTARYTLKLYKNTAIYVLAGAYAGFGIAGWEKYDYDLFGKYYTGKRDMWGKHSNKGWRRPDAGAVAGAGLTAGRIGLEYNYYLGLADLSVNPDEQADITHRVMQLGVTFRL